ncbi:MAG: MFS transporter [Gorillibacterium sp.]|nr:MFS transporter [Gorillibacterium sp.]
MVAAEANKALSNTKQKLAFSSGNLSVNLLAQAFATYIVFYYVDELGVRPGLISLAMVIHGIFNAILNPLIGHLSDRTHSRWGRRYPYMLFGVAPLAAIFTMIWFPIGSGMSLFWYFLITVLVYDASFVVVVLNYSALFPEMFVTMEERTSVSSWRQVFGIIGMIIGVALPPLIYGKLGWGPMGLIFSAVALIFFLIMLRGSKEKPQQTQMSLGFIQAIRYTFANKAFITFVLGSFFVQVTFALLPAGIPFFSKYVLHEAESANSILLGAIFISAILLVYVWNKLTRRFGVRITIMTAVVFYGLALSTFAFVHTLTMATFTAIAVGAGLSGLLVLLDVMLSEVIDEDERTTGVRREGMYFGMNGFIVRWGVSLQAVIMGTILETSGYAAHQDIQPLAVESGIRLMLSLVPAGLLLFALLFFFLYPIRSTPQGSADLPPLNPGSKPQ